MKNKLPLTICIMTHRADDRFQRCLESSRFADEIIVLDNHSGNDWQQLAHHNPVVIPAPGPITDFAAVRNQGLKSTTHDWVLFLDSDEHLPDDTSSKVASYIENDQTQGYYLMRHDCFIGRDLSFGEAVMPLVRLMRKNSARFINPVHEVAIIDGKTKTSQVKIKHQPHLSISDFLDKVFHYAKLVAYHRPVVGRLGFLKLILEIFFYPPAKFVYNYVLRLGFLDGWRGLTYALIMSLHSLYVRIYQYEKYCTHPQTPAAK
jgi:glycosyltransferase involved in cell wall biosynthesis